MAYRCVLFSVTLNDLEGHSPAARLFKYNSVNVNSTTQAYRAVSTTQRGPSATAELFVFFFFGSGLHFFSPYLWDADYV